MTDIFTHSIVLQNISSHLKRGNGHKVLDIGTGHGYLAYTLFKIFESNGLDSQKIYGIDLNK